MIFSNVACKLHFSICFPIPKYNFSQFLLQEMFSFRIWITIISATHFANLYAEWWLEPFCNVYQNKPSLPRNPPLRFLFCLCKLPPLCNFAMLTFAIVNLSRHCQQSFVSKLTIIFIEKSWNLFCNMTDYIHVVRMYQFHFNIFYKNANRK